MNVIIGISMVIGGLIFGLWAGVWWALVGGVMDIVEASRAPILEEMDVAIGVLKVVFFAVIGRLTALLLIIPGAAILKS